jgi:hypothetical protein
MFNPLSVDIIKKYQELGNIVYLPYGGVYLKHQGVSYTFTSTEWQRFLIDEPLLCKKLGISKLKLQLDYAHDYLSNISNDYKKYIYIGDVPPNNRNLESLHQIPYFSLDYQKISVHPICSYFRDSWYDEINLEVIRLGKNYLLLRNANSGYLGDFDNFAINRYFIIHDVVLKCSAIRHDRILLISYV